MSIWFTFICYIMFVYGISIIVTHGLGPFNIFFKLRMWAENVSDNFGELFKCMLCFPTNVGIVFSLVNWFFIDVKISPFVCLLDGTGLWWMAAIMDGCLAGGLCRFIYNIEDYIDKSTPIFEDE